MFLRIGLDLDNTIIDYRPLFAASARRLGLADLAVSASKETTRDRLRALPDGELQWQRVQADVYGIAIDAAAPFPGFTELLDALLARGAFVAIVSHKTRFAAAAPSGPELREAALRWLHAHGVVGPGRVAPENVHFESTRGAKLARIAALELTHFIDDLAEVLDDPRFPATTQGLRFVDSWRSVGDALWRWPE